MGAVSDGQPGTGEACARFRALTAVCDADPAGPNFSAWWRHRLPELRDAGTLDRPAGPSAVHRFGMRLEAGTRTMPGMRLIHNFDPDGAGWPTTATLAIATAG